MSVYHLWVRCPKGPGSCRCLWSITIWVLGIEFGFFKRAASALNWAISPSTSNYFITMGGAFNKANACLWLVPRRNGNLLRLTEEKINKFQFWSCTRKQCCCGALLTLSYFSNWTVPSVFLDCLRALYLGRSCVSANFFPQWDPLLGSFPVLAAL